MEKKPHNERSPINSITMPHEQKQWIVEPVSSQLKAARIYNAITQQAASNLTGYTQAYISKIEAGKRLPTLQALLKFCEVYDCQIIISK